MRGREFPAEEMAEVPQRESASRGWSVAAAAAAVLALCAAVDAADQGLVAKALAGPMGGSEEIIFVERSPGTDGHYYANFGYWVDNPKHMLYGKAGSRLCRMNLRTGEVRVLLEDAEGTLRDPQVHYDGHKILFSYRKGGQPYFHLYEIQADGTGLRQLTDGPFDDVEPTYLPDGDIVLGSSRCNRYVACWFTHVATLYRCDGDGGNLRPISSSIVHDNTPWVMADGRLLYTRWEYVDRSRVQFHHLWTVNPDGTGQMTYYGNMHGGTVMVDAKPIAGTEKVVCIFSPGHGQSEHAGDVTVVDPNVGPDDRSRARRISEGNQYRDPYALSEDLFLVARERSVLLMDSSGATEMVYEMPAGRLADARVQEPRPLRPRPREPIIPARVNPSRATGRLVLADVTPGRSMAGLEPGEIKKLLVLEQLPKPVNFSGEQEPLTLGGSFALARILGTVPVRSDGSADFEVPALRNLYFVALDENDLSVKRMQSFVTVQPGETTGCVGCHEQRNRTAPVKRNLMALRRPPARIEPIGDVPEVLDFPRDIQPILDKHCVSCHRWEKPEGDIILARDHGPRYSHAYATLVVRGLVSDGRDAGGNRAPRKIGSSASRLMKLIDGSHYEAKPSDHERKVVRLWIESGAVYAGTYASLGSGMVGVGVDKSLLGERCGGCHQREKDAVRLKTHPELAYNLSRPEQSLVLLAPLARRAGGWGVCRAKAKAAQEGGSAAEVFEDTSDAGYQALLASIRKAKKRLDEVKRFDVPGFRPNAHYVREMKRFGILPADLAPDAPIDVYATDEAYWRSFWHKPAAHRPEGVARRE